MNQTEITAIYQTLDTLEVRLDQTAELGPLYLKDKLLECREKQNTVTDLIIKVNKSYSAARQALRAQQAAVRNAGPSEQAARLRQEEEQLFDEQDSTKLLLDALNVRRGNLSRTSSDIRLLEKIIEEKRFGGSEGRPQQQTAPPRDVAHVLDKQEEYFASRAQEPLTKPQPPVIKEPHEIVVPPTVVAAPAPEPQKVQKVETTPMPTLAADLDEDIDAFLNG